MQCVRFPATGTQNSRKPVVGQEGPRGYRVPLLFCLEEVGADRLGLDRGACAVHRPAARRDAPPDTPARRDP